MLPFKLNLGMGRTTVEAGNGSGLVALGWYKGVKSGEQAKEEKQIFWGYRKSHSYGIDIYIS